MTAPDRTSLGAPQLLYRDDRLCVVAKPSGMAVHRGWAVADAYLVDHLRALVGRATVHPGHRLDQPTSGCVVVAFDADAARQLGAQFAAHTVFKRYLALVRGPATPEFQLVDHAMVDADGPPDGPRRPARTWIRGLTRGPGRYDLIEALPLTGRTHQIRRHLKHLSWHIIGDVRYGKGEHNRLFRDQYGLFRMGLHALDIAFDHPDDGRRIAVRAPLPADFAGPMERAGIPFEAALPAAAPPFELLSFQVRTDDTSVEP